MTWRSVNDKHAIERAAFAITFEEQVPTKVLQAAVVTEEFVAAGFTPFAPPPMNQDLVINIRAGTPPEIVKRNDALGFRVIRSGDIIEEIIFRRNLLVYATTRYSRWTTTVRPRIADLLGNAATEMLHMVNISTMKFEYWDRFIFDGPPEEAEFNSMLNANSEHVPKFCHTMRDLWHAHIGYFTGGENSQKRLINAKLDALDITFAPKKHGESGLNRRSLGIYSMAEDRFVPGSIPPATLNLALDVADEMHGALKDVLRDIIHPELADSIALDRGEA